MITLEVKESTDAVDAANPLILPIVIVPSIFKVLSLESHTNLSPKLKSPLVAAVPPCKKNAVLEFPCVPTPENNLSLSRLIPQIEPADADIVPVKNTFSLNNPNQVLMFL